MASENSLPTSPVRATDWNPDTFSYRDMAKGAACPKCDSKELQVEVFVGRTGHFNGFEIDEYEEIDETLITWVRCGNDECYIGIPLLDRTLVEAAQAEAAYQKAHEGWPPPETLEPGS